MDELFLGIPVLYWIIGVVALVAIIAIIVIICCAVNIKKKKARAAEESISAQPAPVTYEEPSKPEPVVETAPVQEEIIAPCCSLKQAWFLPPSQKVSL